MIFAGCWTIESAFGISKVFFLSEFFRRFNFVIPTNFFPLFQAEFYTMCHARYAEITARVNITESTLVMVAQGFSSALFVVTVNTFANQNVMDSVKLTKRTEISAALVVLNVVLKSAWIVTQFNMNVVQGIRRFANKWQCSSTKMPPFDIMKHFSWHHRNWFRHLAWIWQFHALQIHSWHHHRICPIFHHQAAHHHQPSRQPHHRKQLQFMHTTLHHRHIKPFFIKVCPILHILWLLLTLFVSQPLNCFSWTWISLKISHRSPNSHFLINCYSSKSHGANFSSWESLSTCCQSILLNCCSLMSFSTPPVTSQSLKSQPRLWFGRSKRSKRF